MVISPPETLQHSLSSTNSFSTSHINYVPSEEISHTASPNRPYQTVVSCTTHLPESQSSSRCIETVQSEVQFSEFQEQAPLSQTEFCEVVSEGVLHSNILSAFPSDPAGTSIFNSPYMSTHISDQSEHNTSLSHGSTEIDFQTKSNVSYDHNTCTTKTGIIYVSIWSKQNGFFLMSEI